MFVPVSSSTFLVLSIIYAFLFIGLLLKQLLKELVRRFRLHMVIYFLVNWKTNDKLLQILMNCNYILKSSVWRKIKQRRCFHCSLIVLKAD